MKDRPETDPEEAEAKKRVYREKNNAPKGKIGERKWV